MKIFIHSFLVIISFCSLDLYAQETKLIKRKNGQFYEEFLVLKSDTSTKNGLYIKKYKDYIIERGIYKNGNKSGKWAYFSFDGIFDFEYDYSTRKILKIAGKDKPEDYWKTPIFFEGSPIIPYLYMARNIRYPAKAKKENINGRITLAVKINKYGEIRSLHLEEKLHPLLDKEVIEVAKTFPNTWKWIPATYHGKNIDGEYHIDIEFELVDDSLSNK